MEKLAQKYTKYFYMALLCGIVWQLLEIVFGAINGEINIETVILLVLSVVNIMILGGSLIHNIKQEFTECKTTTRIARLTVGILTVFQAYLCFRESGSLIALGNHIMTVVIFEIGLTFRIKSIEHLEKLASRLSFTDEENIIL